MCTAIRFGDYPPDSLGNILRLLWAEHFVRSGPLLRGDPASPDNPSKAPRLRHDVPTPHVENARRDGYPLLRAWKVPEPRAISSWLSCGPGRPLSETLRLSSARRFRSL